MSEEKKLFTEFPPVSTEEWESLIKKDLKGGNFKQKLLWKTGEGISVLPFYRSEDREPADEPILPDRHQWKIRQIIYDHKIDKAHKTAQTAIKNGADALQFGVHIQSVAGAIGPDLTGTAIQTQQDFSRLLSKIPLTKTDLHFNTGMMSPVFMAMLADECEKQQIDATEVAGSFLFDPFAFILKHGRLPNDDATITDTAFQLAEFCAKKMPGIKPLGTDAQIYHNAGATIVQELGYALAAGSEYLATLREKGAAGKAVASAIHFNFSIGSNYFLEISKFRAARKLWKTILKAYDIDDTKMVIHGQSSAWNKTLYEPYTNMLRTTTEGIAAALGGCDSITIDPFDASFRQPNDFSKRIARNSQVILKDEAYLNKVSDPAAGSWYIETLTDKIAAAAWSVFQTTEQQGGFMQAIKEGFIQTAIAKSRKEKDEAIANNERIFVGASKYINGDEHPEENGIPAGHHVVSMKKTQDSADIDTQNLISSIKSALNDGLAIGDIVPALFDMTSIHVEPLPQYRAEEIINKQNTDDTD